MWKLFAGYEINYGLSNQYSVLCRSYGRGRVVTKPVLGYSSYPPRKSSRT